MFSIWSYLVGFVLFFFAGFTKGMVGFGVNVISVPLMSLLVGPKAAIALVSLPSFLNNVIIVLQRRERESWGLVKRVSSLLVFGGIGITLGSILLVSLDVSLISILLGILTIVFVLTEKARKGWRIPDHHERLYAPPAGFVAGILGGVSGVSAPILVTYLYSLKLDKKDFVYTISAIFVIFNGVQGINFWVLGLYTPESALFGLSYIIPIILGTIVGTRFQDKISQQLFNYLVLGTLFIVGLDLIRRGLHPG